MTRQELLTCLHQYTPWETLHLKNLGSHHEIDRLNQSLDFPIGDDGKNTGLHLPRVPDQSGRTFSEPLFFPPDSGQEIRVVQHDRYTPSMLHKHDFFELIYVYEGEFIQQISSRKFRMQTGDFCLIPPEVYHALDVCNYSVVLNILIAKNKYQRMLLHNLPDNNLFSDLLSDRASSKPLREYLLFHTDGNLELQKLVLDICREELSQESGFLYMMSAELLLLFGLLLRHFSGSCEAPPPKQDKQDQNIRILRYMDKNYRSVTLQELANTFHYSPQHMTARIKQLTGMSFTAYILQKRMQAASDLLIKTNLKIKEISEAAGYHNQEHFTRTFRRYYGLSPNQYRGAHQVPASLL